MVTESREAHMDWANGHMQRGQRLRLICDITGAHGPVGPIRIMHVGDKLVFEEVN